ncbi:MAG TPA: hypothetical protein VJT50_03030 [Pyrinomonadaceae bacterium]|nr:hypothetical protein [Pyrinomonadaceae bacterium]
MTNLVRLLQAAVVIAAAAFVILLLQVKSDFPYASPFYVRIVGIPALIVLIIAVFWISSWSSTKAIIYGSLVLALVLELVPMFLFLRNDFPSSYYIDPQGRVVLSTFPGNVFEGRSKGSVNDDVLAAYNWQQGKTSDPSGKLLRFYRVRPDGTVLIFEYPVENGEVLHSLDNATLEKYEAQQLNRADSFIREGDLVKAKEILRNILNYDPYADKAYRLNRRIEQQEEQEKAEAERIATEKAEAERLAAEESETATAQNDDESTRDGSPNSTPVVRNHSQRYRSRQYSSEYYPAEQPSYYTPPASSCCRQSSITYAQPAQNYVQPAQTYVQPQPPQAVRPSYPPPSNVPQVSTPVQNPTVTYVMNRQSQTERKKGMSWKKKFLIGLAIAGGVATEEVIRHNRK